MDMECSGFTFLSNFDSGNLGRVELVPKKAGSHHTANNKGHSVEDIPDFEFNIWTKPDCAGTEFENGNRTWFYFGIKGGVPFSLVKLNIVNLNKQSKMYSQGMAPVFRVSPGRHHWERIKDRPSYVIEDNTFILSFRYRILENIKSITYFAFTYPYTFTEAQNMLRVIDNKYFSNYEHCPEHLDDVYYHRECVCYSLEGRRIDLLTISSYHNISCEREPRLKNLFPDSNIPRPFKFFAKKIIFISARVHPGETPSSFVFNGLLNLLLCREDPVACILRKLYVFKMIPMLNPDGVFRGHYRTDTRGVNLNRVYLNPSFILHPSVYAARALIRYHHYGKEIEESIPDSFLDVSDSKINLLSSNCSDISLCDPEPPNVDLKNNSGNGIDEINNTDENSRVISSASCIKAYEKNEQKPSECSKQNNSKNIFATIRDTLLKTVAVSSTGYNSNLTVYAEDFPNHEVVLEGQSSPKMEPCNEEILITDGTSLYQVEVPDNENGDSSGSSSGLNSSSPSDNADYMQYTLTKDHSNIGEYMQCSLSKKDVNFSSQLLASTGKNITVVSPNDVTINSEDSGLFLYVDLHGHASKKGIFMYGNHFNKPEDSIECMLLPKIMSLNCPNFHFTACNFTERNMYLRDRRDGMSREGSGRVAVLKITGLVRSYTLECNYNTGRLVNVLPPCVRDSTKSNVILVPPKYTPQVYEEVGRAMGASILDLTGQNPYSRIPNSEFRTLAGIKDWLRIHSLPEQTFLHKSHRAARRQQSKDSQMASVTKSTLRTSNTTIKNTPLPRSHRLLPITSKMSDNKGNPNIGVEDQERKENLSSFATSSHSSSQDKQISNSSAVTKSSKNAQKSGTSGVLKQVLSVQTKCTVVSALTSSSKIKSSTRTFTKKGNLSCKRLGKLANNESGQKTSKQIGTENAPTGSKLVSEHKSSDQDIIKQGSKRMRITPSKGDQVILGIPESSANLKSDGFQNECVTFVDVKLSDITLLSLNKEKKKSKFNSIQNPPDMCSSEGSSSKDNNLLVSWDATSKSEILSINNDQSTIIKTKLSQTNLVKSHISFPRTNKSNELLATVFDSHDNSTKSEKQGKNRSAILSPVKTLKKHPSFSKKTSSEGKKKGKASFRHLASSSGKLRLSVSSEGEKKRKKSKQKFL